MVIHPIMGFLTWEWLDDHPPKWMPLKNCTSIVLNPGGSTHDLHRPAVSLMSNKALCAESENLLQHGGSLFCLTCQALSPSSEAMAEIFKNRHVVLVQRKPLSSEISSCQIP
jgi:hypothetical protein